MSHTRRRSRQNQDPWPPDLLRSWRSYYLDSSLAPSSRLSYTSALQSYRDFCSRHYIPVTPTADTLSLFITFRSHAIWPSSISSYLSAVVSQLEPFYPEVRAARQSPLVRRTLAGIHRVHGQPVHQKQPLTPDGLLTVISHFPEPMVYDDLLFVTQLLLGFDQLLRLGELCPSADPRLYDVRRAMKRFDVHLTSGTARLLLPGHKADKFFEGSTLQISQLSDPINPYSWFLR